ncbi:MAG: hypothetical protein U0641_09800 [Anaerolineae bacterium]
MSAAPQPDDSAPPDNAGASAGGTGQPPSGSSPPPPGATEPPGSDDDGFYREQPLSRSQSEGVIIGDRAVGIVLARGRKSAPYPAGKYRADALLPLDAETGTLFAVRTGTIMTDIMSMTVQSLDRADVDVELCCVVYVDDASDVIDEREPEAKLDLVVEAAARAVFGRFTSEQLNGVGPAPVNFETLIREIHTACVNDFKTGRGVAGLTIQRIDFGEGEWVVREDEGDAAPIATPPQGAPPTPAPPADDAQLLDLLDRNPALLKEVVAACLSEATSLGMLPADAGRFDAIQDAQAVLLRDQRLRLRLMVRGTLPAFKGGAGSGTP